MSVSAAPAVTWRVRVVRRVAGSFGAAVVIAGVVPAVANAAGASVPNPVAVVLRASGHQISHAFSSSSTESLTSCTSTEPTSTPSVEPTAVASEPVEPTAVPTESLEPTAEPSVEPSESEAPDEECESAAPTATPSASASESPEASEAPESEDPGHGEIVSTVAHCAPKGKDPLLAVEGAPANHGAFVQAAAHGDSLATPWGTFDLSSQAGADALCAAVDAARAALPAETAAPSHGKAHQEHGKHGKAHESHSPDDESDD